MLLRLRNLRMKQQALLIQGTIILLVLCIITIVVIPKSLYEIQLIKTTSHDALIKSNDNKVSQLSDRIKFLIDYAFLYANLTLNKAQHLYLRDINSYYELKLGIQKQQNSKYFLALWQSSDNETQNLNITQFKKYSNLLSQIDQFLISFYLEYQSNLVMVTRIGKPHFSSIFSFLPVPKTFDIQNRPQYTEHITQNSTRIIGSPFISISSQKILLSVSQTIYDKNQIKDAVLFIGIQFENLIKYLSLNNIKFVLCTSSGILVTSNMNKANQVQTFKELLYIFNQTIFPFNKDDWDQMNKYLQNTTYQSNCRQAFIKFCRNIDGSDIQIEAQFIQTKFIQIIFNDLSFTKLEGQIQSNNIENLIISTIIYGFLFLFWCLLILIFSTLLISRMIKPIAEMVYVVDLQIRTSSLDQEENFIQEFQQANNLFCELQNSITSFIQRHLNYKKKRVETHNLQKYPKLSHFKLFKNKRIGTVVDQPKATQKRHNYFKTDNDQNKKQFNNCILSKIDQIIQEY